MLLGDVEDSLPEVLPGGVEDSPQEVLPGAVEDSEAEGEEDTNNLSIVALACNFCFLSWIMQKMLLRNHDNEMIVFQILVFVIVVYQVSKM